MYEKYNTLTVQQKTFFIIRKLETDNLEVVTLIAALNSELIPQVDETNRIYFAFSDTSTSKNHPGWPLRNYIALILCHW